MNAPNFAQFGAQVPQAPATPTNPFGAAVAQAPAAAPVAAATPFGAGMFAGATLMGNVTDCPEGVTTSKITKIEQMPASGKGGPYVRVSWEVTAVHSGSASVGFKWHSAKNIGHPGTVEAKYLGAFMLAITMAACGFTSEQEFKQALAQSMPQSDDPFRDFGALFFTDQNPLKDRECLVQSTREPGKPKAGQAPKMYAKYQYAALPK